MCNKFTEYGTVFAVGGLGYGFLEVAFRGFTHWTMLLTGGACFSFMYAADRLLPKTRLWTKALVCGVAVTEIEFIVGCLVNKICHMGVWDYSDRFSNIAGQICPEYSLLWVAVSLPALQLCRVLRNRLCGKNQKNAVRNGTV